MKVAKANIKDLIITPFLVFKALAGENYNSQQGHKEPLDKGFLRAVEIKYFLTYRYFFG